MTRTRNKPVQAIALLAALAASGSAAQAGVTAVTGTTTWLVSPPAACTPGALTGNTAKVWNEQQAVGVSLLAADLTNNPGFSSSPVPGLISGSVNSHFIHWEGTIGSPGVSGSVTFSQTIIGVIFKPANLNASDTLPGGLSTVYPTGYPFRGLNSISNFSITGNVLKYKFSSVSLALELVQLRVVTQAPTPGGAALLGLGGAVVALRRRRA